MNSKNSRVGIPATRTARLAALLAAVLLAVHATAARGDITFLKSWGSYGTADGQLFWPGGIGVSPSGDVYVADSYNDRIQKFTANGAFIKKFGTSGTGDGQFDSPRSVAFGPGGELYVADTWNDRIQKFTADEVFVMKFGATGTGDGQFDLPFGVAVSADGEVYVADTFNDRLQKFTADGAFVMKFGTAGTGDGQFDNPGDVAVNSVGQVYVSEALNSRVQKFTASGVFLTKFGVAGAGDGQFSAPNGVAVNASGEIYVADTANDRIQKFTASGGFLSKFGVPGNGDGQFNEPQDVAVSRTGEIFIVDTLNHRIQKWFDLDAWVSGSPHLAAAAVGPGKLLGESLTLDAARGLVVDGATVIDAGGTLAQQGGQVSTGSCTNNGQFTINGSTLTLTAGTLINNAALALVAGTVAGKVVNSYGGVMLASGQIGQLDNYAQLTLTGVLQVDGAASNFGTMAVSAAKTLRQNALLDNYGVIELSGGGISGAGSLGNHAGAVIRGSGSVAVPLTNDGGLVHATDSSSLLITDLSGGNTAGGELRIDNGSSIRVQTSFSNYGLIYLKGANAELSGGVIGNYRTIRGEGWISNRVNNNGVLRAEGGQLTVSAGSCTNTTFGAIECPAGATVAFTQGLGTNAGPVALDGGTFDNGNAALANSGSILGRGTLRTGGLTNSGTISLADGISTVYGAVTNTSTGVLRTDGTASTLITFFGLVSNSAGGTVDINGGTVRFLGGTSGTVGNAGAMTIAAGASAVLQNGSGELVQTAGTLFVDDQATVTARTLAIQGGTISAGGPTALVAAGLDYSSPASSTFEGRIAGTGKTLVVNNPAAVLTLSGDNDYTGGTSVLAGTLNFGNALALPPGSNVTVGTGGVVVFASGYTCPIAGGSGAHGPAASPVPEPCTLLLLAVAAGLAIVLKGRPRAPQRV